MTPSRIAACCLFAATLLATQRAHCAPTPSTSFARFDARARSGERLNVVFFGGSLTWGANASDPQTTGYRARMAEKFAARYPRARFRFFDAAIGGTGSQLGAFRLGRDVLRHKPDLVFLDFSLNDGLDGRDEETMASYEAIVRRTIGEAKCPLVQVYFPDAAVTRAANVLARVELHRKIARAYGCGEGDAIAWMRGLARRNPALVDAWWPHPNDKTHPGDAGYATYADAVWSGFLDAVRQKKACRAPASMLHAATYLQVRRAPLATLAALPTGWSAGQPNRTGAWFDSLMSRWLDSEAVAQSKPNAPPAPMKLRFRGTMALLFGEMTPQSGKVRVLIDGAPAPQRKDDGVWDLSSKWAGGNIRFAEVVAQVLEGGEHTLELVPILEDGQELRLESLCVAGDGASVSLDAAEQK